MQKLQTICNFIQTYCHSILAEYASIILICVLNSLLFLGGYLSIIPLDIIIDIIDILNINKFNNLYR